MSTFAARKKTATPAEATVWLCLDLRLHDKLRAAYYELRRRELRASRERQDDAVTLDQAQERNSEVDEQLDIIAGIDLEIEAASEPYKFRKLQPHQWSALMEQCPPTDEQLAEAKQAREENPNEPTPDIDGPSFWPLAVSECSVDPKLTEADARWLRDGDDEWTGLPPTEWNRITVELRDLHSTGVVVPKELLHIARTLRSARNGTTPTGTASRSASSAAASRKGTKRTG